MRRFIATVAILLVALILTGCGRPGHDAASSETTTRLVQGDKASSVKSPPTPSSTTTAETPQPPAPTANLGSTTTHRTPTSTTTSTTSRPPTSPPPPPPIETDSNVVVTDECGTAGDGLTLFPFTGCFYVDTNGVEMPASGVLVPMTGAITFFAKTVDGYVFPGGLTSQQFDVIFTDVACLRALA